MSGQHVVIVGASLGGLRTAQALRSNGFSGDITLVGDETHKPYDRPPLSKHVLSGEWEAGQTSLADDAELDKLGAELKLGVRAGDLDAEGRTVGLDGGDRLAYDHLVIATGASPRMLPGVDRAPGVHVLRTLDDCLALRAGLDKKPNRVVVVGAGFIGAEVAATARQRGLEVTVLEALPVPLARGLGPTLGPVIAAIHEDHGVELRLGTGVAGVEQGRVDLADGTAIDAEVVVVGIGVIPNTSWLDGSGLTVEDGVVCDAACQAVGAEGVWAVGDVARWEHPVYGSLRIEHWTNAVEQAMAVAASIVGEPQPFAPVPYVWSDQYGSKIQVVGRPGPDDEVHIAAGSFDDRRFIALTHQQGRVTGAVGIDEPRRIIKLKRLLGGQLSLEDATAAVQ